jgi:hypothetical protein
LQFIFNTRDPIIVGVMVENGIVKEGTPLCVPGKEVRNPIAPDPRKDSGPLIGPSNLSQTNRY